MTEDCSGGLLKAQDTAAELYQLAALMLGSENDALSLVEKTVAEVEIDPCDESDSAVDQARHQLVKDAVAMMSQAKPEDFVAPAASDSAAVTCLDDDDFSAAGVLPAAISELIGGEGRQQLRVWLDKLPLAQRAIFVQRAILGWNNSQTAESLPKNGGWSASQVSDLFRQALCSLTSSLVHSTAQGATA
jgi:hypothetical protein